MALPLLVGSAIGTTETYVRESIIPPVYAQVDNELTIEEKINFYAEKHGIASTTLYNLVWSESRLDPNADNGKDRGIVQINREAWPDITDEQAFDVDFSLDFASSKIASGDEYLWTVCNCYSYAKTKVKNLPSMADIVPNSNYPRVGGIVVLRYKNAKHIAVVEKVVEKGVWISEMNFEPCKYTERLIEWDDPALKGFVSYEN